MFSFVSSGAAPTARYTLFVAERKPRTVCSCMTYISAPLMIGTAISSGGITNLAALVTAKWVIFQPISPATASSFVSCPLYIA